MKIAGEITARAVFATFALSLTSTFAAAPVAAQASNEIVRCLVPQIAYWRAGACSTKSSRLGTSAAPLLCLMTSLHPKGQENCDAVLQLDPDNLEALFGRAAHFIFVNQPDRAMADYSAVVAKSPSCGDAYVNRGCLSLYAGQPRDAIGDFDRALALNEADAAAHHGKALALEQMGRRDEAIARYRLARQHVDPKSILKQWIDGSLKRLGAVP